MQLFAFRLSDFKAFGDVLEAAKAKSVVVAVASEDDITAANNTSNGLFNVRKAL